MVCGSGLQCRAGSHAGKGHGRGHSALQGQRQHPRGLLRAHTAECGISEGMYLHYKSTPAVPGTLSLKTSGSLQIHCQFTSASGLALCCMISVPQQPALDLESPKSLTSGACCNVEGIHTGGLLHAGGALQAPWRQDLPQPGTGPAQEGLRLPGSCCTASHRPEKQCSRQQATPGTGKPNIMSLIQKLTSSMPVHND